MQQHISVFFDKKYHMNDIDYENLTNEYQIPVLKKQLFDQIPNEAIAFSDIYKTKEKNKIVHFFQEDRKIESVWNNPYKYIPILQKFPCVIEPDFSILLDMPKPIQIYNIFRTRLIGTIFQKNGINVIPNVSWAGKNSYDFCFNGIYKHGVIAVSTVGISKNNNSKQFFQNGFVEMLNRLKPCKIIMYGGNFAVKYSSIPILHIHNTTYNWISNSNMGDK